MGLEFGAAPCGCEHREHTPKLIAITGGPGAGKTAVLQMATRVFCRHVAVLPEAAGIVFGGGFPRHASRAAGRSAQRAIFYVQQQLERLVVEERAVAVALCDRGTLDGAAYWDGPPAEYWAEFGLTPAQELERYTAVIHMQTPGADQGYNQDNPLRIESAPAALAMDERIAAAWRAHPHRVVVPSTDDFTDKALRALHAIRAELPECCHRHRIEQ